MSIYNPFDWYWAVGSDESRFWSSAAGSYVGALPGGAGVTRILNEVDLTDVLAAYGLPGPLTRRRVEKWLIAGRIEAAGKSDAAYELLTTPGNRAAFIKWNMPIESVFHDDPDTLLFINALGLDPAVIMAA